MASLKFNRTFFTVSNICVLLLGLSFLGLFLKNNLSSITLILLFVFSQINFFVIEKRHPKELLGIFALNTGYRYLLFYFGLLLLSVFYSEDINLGLRYLTRHTVFLVLPITFYCLPDLKKDEVNRIKYFFVLLIAFLFVFLLINAIYKNHLKGNSLIEFIIVKIENILGFTDNKIRLEYWYFTYEGLTQVIDIQPIYLSLFVNLAFVFLIKLKVDNRITNLVFWILSIEFLIFNVLLSSRSETLIFLLIFVVYNNLIKPKSRKQYIVEVLKTMGVGVVFLGFIFSNPILKYRVMTVFDSSVHHKHLNFSNQSVRLIKWENAFEEVLESPIFGHGIGDYKNDLIERYKVNNFKVGVDHEYNSHNQYLDTTLQIGIIGLVLLLMIFHSGLFSKNSNNFEIKFIFGVFLLSFVTESMFGRHWGIVSFVLFVCFIFKYNSTLK